MSHRLKPTLVNESNLTPNTCTIKFQNINNYVHLVLGISHNKCLKLSKTKRLIKRGGLNLHCNYILNKTYTICFITVFKKLHG